MFLKKISLLTLSLLTIASQSYSQPYEDCYAGPLTYPSPYGCCWESCHDVINNWSINGAFLWWKTNADGLALGEEFCINRHDENPSTGIFNAVTKHSHTKTPKFKFDPGVKLGIDYAFPGNCWDTRFEWTYYRTEATAHGESCLDPNSPPGNHYLAFINFWETLAFNFPNCAKGKYTLDINLYDLEVGKTVCLSSCFLFRPNFGLRVASIDQKYRITSEAHQSGVFNSASYLYTSDVKASCNFVGGGPRLGFDTELNLCWGLSLFADAAGSLVFGKFDRHSREVFDNKDFFFYKFNEFKDHTHGNNNDFATRAITDLEIGIEWNYAFSWLCRPYWVSLGLSWEHHGFFNFSNFAFDSESFECLNQNAFDFGPYANLLQSQKKHGDIFTQGITLNAAFGF